MIPEAPSVYATHSVWKSQIVHLSLSMSKYDKIHPFRSNQSLIPVRSDHVSIISHCIYSLI